MDGSSGMTVAARKRAMRLEMRSRLAGVGFEERRRWSGAAGGAVVGSRAFGGAGVVMLFLSLPDEVDCFGLVEASFAAGKRVCLPRVDWESGVMEAVEVSGPGFVTEVRRHGVREPVGEGVVAAGEVGLVVVPGLAFDRAGWRLGRGKGFYDRFLSRAGAGGGGPVVMGMCFGMQVVGDVPREAGDVGVGFLATEGGVEAVGAGGC